MRYLILALSFALFSTNAIRLLQQDCEIGTYLDSATNTCKPCSDAIPNCDSCDNSTSCILCQPGYYLNPASTECLSCGANCVYCENDTECLSCDNTTILIQGKCHPLPESARAPQCEPGTYLVQETGECVSCMYVAPNCTNCTDEDTCTGCDTGFELRNGECVATENMEEGRLEGIEKDDDSESKLHKCRSWQYWDRWRKKCRRCSKAIRHCYKCYNKRHCYQCYYGYFKKGKKGCLRCSHYLDYCLACRNQYRCYKCRKGYKVNYKTGKCEKNC